MNTETVKRKRATLILATSPAPAATSLPPPPPPPPVPWRRRRGRSARDAASRRPSKIGVTPLIFTPPAPVAGTGASCCYRRRRRHTHTTRPETRPPRCCCSMLSSSSFSAISSRRYRRSVLDRRSGLRVRRLVHAGPIAEDKTATHRPLSDALHLPRRPSRFQIVHVNGTSRSTHPHQTNKKPETSHQGNCSATEGNTSPL